MDMQRQLGLPSQKPPPRRAAAAADLSAEWRRIECLCELLGQARRGTTMDASQRQALHALQRRVDRLRVGPAWRALTDLYGLDRLDQDLVALALAPDVEPRIGWLYQQLQPGAAGTGPNMSLMQELLGIEPAAAGDFHARAWPGSALQRSSLVRMAGTHGDCSLRPAPRLHHALLGWPLAERDIPGAQRLPQVAGLKHEGLASGRHGLVLAESCQQGLDEFVLWVTQRSTVVGRWGAMPTGGPLALFCGPPGTGKTLAAQTVAHTLGWPLYRVDIGLLVSKYIGETEKNLNALFDAAHGEPLLLLFDEADALFGKRGEVREAHDRYANMEVGHLLTRLERHEGPCVLTTNMRQALDPAFTRRFQVVVDFGRPDANARAALWQLHLPAHAPGVSELDCQALGACVELTGGQIRNAALHAAYLAAGESAAIDLPRIARSVWAELGKSGHERSTSGMGMLAAHLPRSLAHA